MIATVLQGGCNEVSIPVNLQGNYILQTNVIKPPSLLYPWNVSVQYDNVFWASFSVNTGSPDDIYNFNELPVHNINNIVVYFCDQGNYYLTSDEIVLLITISDGLAVTSLGVSHHVIPSFAIWNIVLQSPT